MIQFHDFINIIIKPTDACNLRCKYCFHKNEGYSTDIMDYNTLKKIYDITFPYYKHISIVWHGGEPLCAGLEFYTKAFELQDEYKKRFGVTTQNSMQTNSTLLTQEYVDLLKKYQIRLGVSYDGIINDYTRESTKSVEEKRVLLNKNGLDPGVITVVSNLNVNRLLENYEAMKLEHRNVQYNYYIEMNRSTPDYELLMDADNYINKMYEFFLCWINDEECNVDVQPFVSYISEVLFNTLSVCSHSSCMRSWLCIEHNGDIVACDKQLPTEYSYGNVSDYDDIRQIYNSDGFRNLLTASIKRRELCLKTCDIYQYCEGGCNHSAYVDGDISSNNGFSCKTFKGLFSKIRTYLTENDITADNYDKKLSNACLVSALKKYEKR